MKKIAVYVDNKLAYIQSENGSREQVAPYPHPRVTDERYWQRGFEIDEILWEARYYLVNKVFAEKRKAQFYNVRILFSSHMLPEFNKMQETVKRILNNSNKGLGDAWATAYPFRMANLGNIYSEPIQKLKEIVERFPPGSYKGEQI